MGKFVSSKGTTITYPDGIDPKKLAAIKADADNGYGTRAQQTANRLGKNTSTKPADDSVVPGQNGSIDTTIDPNTGKIKDPNAVVNGAPKAFDPNDPYWQKIYNDTYNNQDDLITEHYGAQKAKDLEDAKQDLADRGIPFTSDVGNPDSTNAYDRTLGNVDLKYTGLYNDASKQAQIAAQGVYGTQGQLANQANDQYIQHITGLSNADFLVYKQGEDYKAQLAAINKSKSGGGGSSGSSAQTGGFDI